MANLLIVDDELGMRQFLTHLLQREGHAVRVAESGRRAMELLREMPADLIISDVKMPDMGGIELLRAAREMLPEVEVIMMTAFARVETARDAFLLGAYDFVQKPFDNELLKETVARALQKISLIKEKEALLEENKVLIQGQRTRGSLNNIIGRSPKMQALYQMIETVAQVQSTVLVTGESGTGKELVARAVHICSPRATEPFVSINCGAFPETLLESELFGYVKGAFTGANQNKRGLFEVADGGTIFLDEIGEMNLTMQVKLLRVLQERCVRPVGGTDEIAIDVRVIAATNRDLERQVAENTFCEDLYYRLNVIPVTVPPLRDRREDVPMLVNHFIKKYAGVAGRNIARIHTESLSLLGQYEWPGNVRQLENTIERAIALETADELKVEMPVERPRARAAAAGAGNDVVSVAAGAVLPEGMDMEKYVAEIERSLLKSALQQANGVQTRAADVLKISYRSFRHLMKKYDV